MARRSSNYRKPVGRHAGGAQNKTPSKDYYYGNSPFSKTLGSRILAEKREEKRERGN